MTSPMKDLIMWVGSKPYMTWSLFADEAARMGVCKRVRVKPKGITLGQSKCYLIHGERVVTKVESTTHGYSVPGQTCRFCGIDQTANSQNPTPCKVHMLRRVGKPHRAIYGYFVIETIFQPTHEQGLETPQRGCGVLKPGAIYLVGPLTSLETPIPWDGQTFVGHRYYQGAV